MQADRNTICTPTSDHPGSSWMRLGFDSPHSLQVGSPGDSNLTLRSDEDEGLSVKEQPRHDEVNIEYSVDFPVADGGIVEESRTRVSGRAGHSFRWFTPEGADLPPLLPRAVPSSGGPTWTVTAPAISKAIQTLLLRLRRTPTDEEIAQELYLTVEHYHEALTLLRDLEFEISTRGVASVEGSDEPILSISGGIDAGVFICLRSEMMRLFRNAVRSLPERELLVISLRYCEDMSDMALSLTLDIPESTLTRLSASAYLHLRARLFGSLETDHYAWGDSVRPPEAKYKREKDTGPEADIYMTSGQDRWLPTGQPWERPGLQSRYTHFSQTWIAVSDEGELKPVKRTQRFELNVEGC
jgi:DNA-directed RNA polymerase specialized sigma24 family protein